MFDAALSFVYIGSYAVTLEMVPFQYACLMLRFLLFILAVTLLRKEALPNPGDHLLVGARDGWVVAITRTQRNKSTRSTGLR